MELVVKHYSELTADELYDILHVRVLVFVVEQKCPYEEVRCTSCIRERLVTDFPQPDSPTTPTVFP